MQYSTPWYEGQTAPADRPPYTFVLNPMSSVYKLYKATFQPTQTEMRVTIHLKWNTTSTADMIVFYQRVLLLVASVATS
jgi:hypothetical protein